MSKQFNKMVTLLKELFQLDQPDLDFGLYRVMHAKSGEITQFLEQDLFPQVKTAFGQYTTADKAELEKELKNAIEQANGLGVDPETTAKVKELRQKIADESVDITALENEVYDYLFSFFRRYYHEGDFLSKRVYKPGVYAIPYEGEEVKLHWANRDQYYIKTNEYLRDYAFTLRPNDATDPMRVHFRLADAAEGEHGNVKAAEGKDRVFILADENFISEEDGELVIRFHYRPATMKDWVEEALAGATAAAKKKPPVQKALLSDAVCRVIAADRQDIRRWLVELSKAHVKTNGEVADYSCLQGHFNRYFKRNTFDYFIHKDLGGFLRQELDFYIKNEVMHLDDIESESVPRVEQYLSKIKVIRKIAHKLIDFLAQLEDFQVKLWLKKKFVIETNYCITLDRIPEEFYPEIASNDAQRKEWVGLFAIDEVDGYTIPLTAQFLRSNKTLVLDTSNFPNEWTSRIVETFDDGSLSTAPLLIHGENFQALSLLKERYSGCIRTTYIDPPYNTGQDGFVYKDSYKDSSWTTMMNDRLALSRMLLSDKGTIFCSINEVERFSLESLLKEVFGPENRVEELIWARDTVSNNSPAYSTNHEYIEVFARDRKITDNDRLMFREQREGYVDVVELVDEMQPNYPPVSEIEKNVRDLYRKHKANHIESATAGGFSRKEAEQSDPWKGLYPYKFAEYRDDEGCFIDQEAAKDCSAKIWVFREVEPSMPSGKQAESIRDPESENYRFYIPVDPKTGMTGKFPKRGWAFPQKSLPARPSFESYCDDNRIVFKGAENIVQQKYFLHEVETVVSTSVIRQYADGEPKLEALFGEKGLIDNPKPPALIERIIRQTTEKDSIVLDYFAGSGTTGHAAIETNRKDGGQRSFILVEAGDYFGSVLVPRIKKVHYSSNWFAGKPQIRDGVSGIFKCVRIESYEDAVNNLELSRSKLQQNLLDLADSEQLDGLKEQYLLRYVLDVETRGSQSLLSIAAFSDPTAYKLKVKHLSSGETREINVDLLETFNYLAGIRVQSIAAPKTFQAAFKRDDEGRLRLDGRLRQDEAGPWWFRAVYGTTPENRRTLIIWRKLTGDAEQDNLVLDEWFTRQGYSTRDYEFDMIYVNGDCNLENLRAPDETWKVRLIEEDFHRLMFDTTGL